MSNLMHLTAIHRWPGSRVSQCALGFFGEVGPLVQGVLVIGMDETNGNTWNGLEQLRAMLASGHQAPMKAFAIDNYKGPLTLRDVPDPAAGSDEIVIAIEAASENPLHLKS